MLLLSFWILPLIRQYNKNPHWNISNEEIGDFTILRKGKNIVIQEPDKGNSVVIVDKKTYIKTTENLLSDLRKCKRISLKNDAF